MRAVARRFSTALSSDIRSWSSRDVSAFLARQNVTPSYLDAFEVQKVTGQALFDKEALLVHYMDPAAEGITIADDVLMDALLRTEGWTVKKD